MGDILATVTFDNLNGVNEDTAVNNFAFHCDGAITQGVIDDVWNGIWRFYNLTAIDQVSALSSYMSSTLDRTNGASVIRLYDITGKLLATVPAGSPEGTKPRPPAHGSPIFVQPFQLGAAGAAASLPSQVAMVLTLRGRNALTVPVEQGNVRPRARHTGRIYLGPLSVQAGEQNNSNPRPTAQFRTDLVKAAESMATYVTGNTDTVWCVWSRANGAMYGITRAEADDSFDVIRSRKRTASARTVETFAPVPEVVAGEGQ